MAEGEYRIARIEEWSIRHERDGQYVITLHHDEPGSGWGTTREWQLGLVHAHNAEELSAKLLEGLPSEVPDSVACRFAQAIVK